MRGAAGLLLVLAALPGCLGPLAEPPGAQMRAFSGAFTEGATQADLDGLRALVEAEGWTMLVMESFPMQYQARGEGDEACERLRTAFTERAFVATVGPCRLVAQGDDPDRPTSSAA